MDIDKLVHEAWTNAEEKGFHAVPCTFGDRIALIHSEASEALEAYRSTGSLEPSVAANGKPEGVPSELADIVIRVADLCGVHGIDLKAAIDEKLAYNKTREHLHGGKKF